MMFWVLLSLSVTVVSVHAASRKCSENGYGKYDSPSDSSPPGDENREEKLPLDLWRMLRNNQGSARTAAKDCPPFYQRYPDHTYCRVSSTCEIISSGVNKEDKDLILEIHNKLRSKLALGDEKRWTPQPAAANMMQMEWDEELAKVAQAHANLCEFKHDGEQQHVVEAFATVGQNLVDGGGSTEKNWIYAENWYKEEVCFFNPSYINPYTSGNDWGHYSQVTWANSHKVGCGFTAYKNNGIENSLYTCNYGPGGNMLGDTQYIVGEACSKCPRNTECSTEYPGLCKSKTARGPQLAPSSLDDYILYCDFNDNNPKECDNVKLTGPPFETKSIFSGTYKTVVLQGGESISIDLGDAQNENGFCPFVYARYGQNNANDPFASSVEIAFSGENIVPQPPSEVDTTYNYRYSIAGIHMDVNFKMQSIVTLKTKANAEPQYFDVQAWGIRKGACGNNL